VEASSKLDFVFFKESIDGKRRNRRGGWKRARKNLRVLKVYILDHLLKKTVDELLSVAEVAALREVIGFLTPSSAGVV